MKTGVRGKLYLGSLGAGPLTALSALLLLVGTFSFGVELANAAPTHPFLESLDGAGTPAGGFDQACGVAVDGEGDVYVADHGHDTIDVFDPTGAFLTSIAAAAPCGLAVDSKGSVYAVTAGNVVKYEPTGGTYPPTAATTYGAPVTFDSSGDATAVAVNPADDRVYVASPSVVTVYDSDGSLNQVNEVQSLRISCTGGSYRLSFKGQQTGPIACSAPGTDPGTPGVVDSVQEALEALSTIGAGNVSVSGAFPTLVTFTGALGSADVPPLVADASGLTGGEARVVVSEAVKGFGGHIGEGVLSKAFGVDVWGANGYVYVSDEGGRIYVFDAKGAHVRAEIDGSVAAGGAGSPGAFGTLPQANVAVDQANGHVFVSDVKESGAVFEFEASGPYVSQIANGFEDAGPTDVAVDPTEGAGHGRVYVSSGSGAGSRVDAFGPLPIPSHPALPSLPKAFNSACGVAVGPDGRVYVTSSGSSSIDVFAPAGKSWNLVATISDTGRPCGVAVDAAGNVYVTHPNANTAAEQTLLMYPPVTATTYGPPKVIDPATTQFAGVAVNPVNQHVLVSHREVVFEYDSAANNSVLLRDDLGEGLGLNEISAVGVYGRNGDVYVTNKKLEAQGEPVRGIVVFDPVANERLAVINGSNAVSKKPDGGIGVPDAASIAVDQANGHVFYSPKGPAADVYEFEASGAYVSRFGRSTENGGLAGVAVDNSGGPNDRDVFVAGGLNGPPTVDVYEAAVYGEPPAVVTGGVSGADGTEATLNGTVDPRGFPLQGCSFEYVDDAGFEVSGFAGAASQACAESLESIGSGSAPVAVHAVVSGLDPGRYHYRLRAENKYGAMLGQARVFGPVVVTTKPASPVLFTEATLRAAVDPDGLPAGYHFEYGESEVYEHSTPAGELAATEGPVDVSAAIFGLTPDTTYHFRIVASNSLGAFIGPDQTLTTSARPVAETCPNAVARSGASAGLPDCRAYELVTPALNGLKPTSEIGTNAETSSFDTWLGAPGGDSLIFNTAGAPPGFAGNGVHNQFRTVRGEGGWSTALVAPTGAQAEEARPGGVSPDHGYAFWRVERAAGGQGSLEVGAPSTTYLRNPDGSFVVLGSGSRGEDPTATGRWIGPGGAHVVFTTASGSAVQLEPAAPASGIAAIYDRTPDGVTHVVSLLPGDETPAADSKYLGVSADGSAVFFAVEGVLYERRDDATTLEVSPPGATFAGASRNGSRVFYLRGGNVFAFDADAGATTQLTSAGGATVVNVSADGSHLYLVSPEQLDGGNGTAGSNNLYVWDGEATRFIALLSTEDLRDPNAAVGGTLAAWTDAVGPNPGAFTGPGFDPSRTTPDGSVFVFQSFANLTSYDSEGHSEIFRYDTAGQSLLCVSCKPDGEPPSAEAELEQVNEGFNPSQHHLGVSPVNALSHIANVTNDGKAVFFQTADSLLPADGDGHADVYEWRSGRLSLISSGGSSNHDYLYGMSADGRDVFFETNDSLVPQDQDGGDPSIYDARVDGGFAAPGAQPCLEDSCQGTPAGAPVLPVPASPSVRGPGNVPAGHAGGCPRGKRPVRRHGHRRCVKKKRRHTAAGHKRRSKSTRGRQGGGR